MHGNEIGPSPRTNVWAIWWDGDPLRELFSGSSVNKWIWDDGVEKPIMTVDVGRRGRNPNLLGDILGDWREELLVTSPDGRSLRLYTTAIPTEHRIYTLLHDPQYRLGIAWQNVAYNKPAHPSFFVGDKMSQPPRPNIQLRGVTSP